MNANLNQQYPECWHLIMQAEDRCRSDHLERTRRNLTRAAAEGRLPMNIAFAVDQPWIGVFTFVVKKFKFQHRTSSPVEVEDEG